MKHFRSSKILILDADDNVLILKRSTTHPRFPLEADLSGGIIRSDETHQAGLVRETYEETQLSISVSDLKLVDMHRSHYKPLFISMERSLFAVRFDERPEVKTSWEHDSFEWIPIEKVHDLEKPIQNQLERAIKKDIFKTI